MINEIKCLFIFSFTYPFYKQGVNLTVSQSKMFHILDIFLRTLFTNHVIQAYFYNFLWETPGHWQFMHYNF